MIDVDAAYQSTLSTESEATLADWVTDDATVATNVKFDEPEDLRRRREELGVSRRAVQEATGLSSSVVWRSESPTAKRISNAEWVKIDSLYAKWAKDGVPAEYAKPAKPAAVAAHSVTNQQVARYAEFVEGLRTSISDKIGVAQSKKARTAELKALLVEVEAFLGTNQS